MVVDLPLSTWPSTAVSHAAGFLLIEGSAMVTARRWRATENARLTDNDDIDMKLLFTHVDCIGVFLKFVEFVESCVVRVLEMRDCCDCQLGMLLQ